MLFTLNPTNWSIYFLRNEEFWLIHIRDNPYLFGIERKGTVFVFGSRLCIYLTYIFFKIITKATAETLIKSFEILIKTIFDILFFCIDILLLYHIYIFF